MGWHRQQRISQIDQRETYHAAKQSDRPESVFHNPTEAVEGNLNPQGHSNADHKPHEIEYSQDIMED